jgi:drug/metabolite transporter (DMT)-like permease
MLRLILLSTLQSLFLVGTQVFLKLAVQRMGTFIWAWEFFKSQLTNWPLAASGICVATATFLWMYILKLYDFSMAYPMISISYIFGMLAAMFIFHETIPVTRWIGVILIMAGVIFVARP